MEQLEPEFRHAPWGLPPTTGVTTLPAPATIQSPVSLTTYRAFAFFSTSSCSPVHRRVSSVYRLGLGRPTR